jgi:hypothetical protein
MARRVVNRKIGLNLRQPPATHAVSPKDLADQFGRDHVRGSGKKGRLERTARRH